MPQMLDLHLLGGLHISLAAKPPLRFASRRAEVLLAYIAMNAQPHSREFLATLLWDDRDQKQAMANLRSLLAQLPKALKPYLTITRHSVSLADAVPIWVDALAFMDSVNWPAETELPIVQLEEALALYKGEFLAGVFVRESRGLEEWTAVTREKLQQQAIAAHFHLAHHYFYYRDYPASLKHAQALLMHDPLREGSHRLLMRLWARVGRLNKAIQQYEQCRTILAAELGVAPAPETRQLQQRLLTAKLPAPFVVPTPNAPLIGRQAALAQLEAQLDKPECRLVSLVGPGGVGKTRLALAVAQQRRHDYLHGVYFVSLVGVETAAAIVTHIAITLNCPLPEGEALETQLTHFLQEKEILLLLDNFEHLLPDGALVLQRLFDAAPTITWLVTSRERLRLPTEWLLPVSGLPSAVEAVELFEHRAVQVKPSFVMDEATKTAVQQICQSVAGLPLGIELAATWVRTLSCKEIAAEVNRSLAILADQAPARPERHHSLYAVFAYSWKLLSPAEQEVLLKLAIFQGGFNRQAAQQVAGASLPLLANLLDKSLLVRDEAHGRYALLEALRQFIQEKWSSQQTQEIRLAHCHYYADFVAADCLPSALGQEMDNVRLAWQIAVQQQPALIPHFIEPLYQLYRSSVWLQEGYELFEAAVAKLTESPLLVAKLQARQGSLAIHLGTFRQAQQLLEASLARIRPLDDTQEYAFVLHQLSRVWLLRSDYDKAQHFAEESYHTYQRLEEAMGMAEALSVQGTIARNKGQYKLATELFSQSLALHRQAADQRGVAHTLNVLANNYCEYGAWDEALPSYEESLAIYRAAADPFNIAKLLNNIGTVKLVRQQFDLAEVDFEESAAICRQIGDQAGLAVAFMNKGINESGRANYVCAERYLSDSLALYERINYPYMQTIALQHSGMVAYQLEQYEAAERYSLTAVRLALSIDALGLAVNTLDNLARLQAREGAPMTALTLVTFVLHSDMSNEEAKARSRQLETILLNQLTNADIEAAQANGRSADLPTILAHIPNLSIN